MSNNETKRELNEVAEMHRKALEELAEAIEQRNEARRAAEHLRVLHWGPPPYSTHSSLPWDK